jgi:hypothetical protein
MTKNGQNSEIRNEQDWEAYVAEKRTWGADEWAKFYAKRWWDQKRKIKGYAAAWDRISNGESDESFLDAAQKGDFVAYRALQILCNGDVQQDVRLSTARKEFCRWAINSPISKMRLSASAACPDIEARTRAVGQAVDWVKQKAGVPIYPGELKLGKEKQSAIEAVAKAFGLTSATVKADYLRWSKLPSIPDVALD